MMIWKSINKSLMLIFCFMVLQGLAGCTTFDAVMSFSERNPEVVNIATRQAVFRYIESSGDEASKREKSQKVYKVVKSLTEFLDANPTATSETLIKVLNSQIDWDGLSIQDRLLVQDIVSLVEIRLSAKEQENLISPDTAIYIKSLLQVVESTVKLL